MSAHPVIPLRGGSGETGTRTPGATQRNVHSKELETIQMTTTPGMDKGIGCGLLTQLKTTQQWDEVSEVQLQKHIGE